MSEIIFTPELVVELQRAARTAGLVVSDVWQLADPDVLKKILPVFLDKAEVTITGLPQPVARIVLDTAPTEILLALRANGVTVTETWGDRLIHEASYVSPLKYGEVYDLYVLNGLKDLGISWTERLARSDYESRGAALGLEKCPPVLAPLLLLSGYFPSWSLSRCHVASEPYLHNSYTFEYFQLSQNKLHTELDSADNDLARSALIEQQGIVGLDDWLFCKRVL